MCELAAQQPLQPPSRTAGARSSGRVTTGERGALGTLRAVENNGATSAGGSRPAGEAKRDVLVPPRGTYDEGHAQGRSTSAARLATVKVEPRSGARAGTDRQGACGEPRRAVVTIPGGERDMRFLHPCRLFDPGEEGKAT